ncbi:MAG: MBOAT family protein [Polyangiales bacterium]
MVLCLAGAVFYSFWDVRYLALLVAAAIIDFFIALAIERSTLPLPRRALLGTSLVFNMGILAAFKYSTFAADNARSLLTLLGLSIVIPHWSIVLPLGISFFTFKSMSYTIDVYRRDVKATASFPKYLAFILLFPDLVAGPIVRYRALSEQLDRAVRRLDLSAVVLGVSLLSVGLFKKVVVADSLARIVVPLWSHPYALTMPTAWIAVLGYSLQLYFDFSGYSDMAIGLAALLGLTFPINFREPYQAVNPSDFFRRWHVSLSTWLRDYLYVPLGGNRASGGRVLLNIFVVTLLGGLWHGAAWTFVLWGAYHGSLLCAYRLVSPRWDALPRLLQKTFTFLLVALGWVLFRAKDISVAKTVYCALIMPRKIDLTALGAMSRPTILIAVLLAWVFLARPSSIARFPATRRPALVAAMIFAVSILFMGNSESPFLYYQF